MAGRYPEISVIVGGQECGGGYDVRDLEIIGEAFRRAALAVRARERGEVVSKMRHGYLVAVSIDDPRVEFDPETFPVLEEIRRR